MGLNDYFKFQQDQINFSGVNDPLKWFLQGQMGLDMAEMRENHVGNTNCKSQKAEIN
jgi:hypothetical protein